MCNGYGPRRPEDISTHCNVPLPAAAHMPELGPLSVGFYIAVSHATVGQWGLIPDRSKSKASLRSDRKPLSTNNCRTEDMASSWTFKRPSEKG